MTGILRYIYWCMGFILFLNVSCNDNDNVPPGEGNDDKTETKVEFILSTTPQSYGTVPGSISERTVRELDILVVKNDIFQYRKEAVQGANSYHSILKIDDGLTLYFIVNSRDLLDNNNQLVEGNSWNNDIRPSLIMTDPTGLISPATLPMWGIKENVAILEGELNQLDDIYLLRSVASVDVYNGENPEVFTLQEAYLYFVPDQGYLAPSNSNYSSTLQDVTVPESPAGMQNYPTPLMSNKVEKETLLYQLYLYENDANTSTMPSKRYSRVVVGGSFKGGATTYYPVDLLDDDLSTILQATRNYKYGILIGSVKSPGYPDPDTASESADTRLEFSVIEWNSQDERELVFDGPYFISMENKKVYLYKPAGATDDLDMRTNIDPADLNMEFTTDKNGEVHYSTDGFSMWNDRFRVEFIFDDNNKIEFLRFTTLQAYNTTNTASNLDAIRIFSNRVTLTVNIEQINESPTDWIDGGNVDVDIDQN